MVEDFVEVNVQPYGNDSGFGIDLSVQDATLNPQPFDITLKFQLEDGEIPGLNLDATNEPDQLIELAKGLLLCDSEEQPVLTNIPADACPPNHQGVYYNVDIDMELDSEGSRRTVQHQQWQVSIMQSPIEVELDSYRLLQMIQSFFINNL